jgi:ribonuclease P protein component
LSDALQGRLLFGTARRVRRSADFVLARESGRRIDGGCFLLWVRNRGDNQPARLGVAASRAVGNAVVRNRCKRLLREVFRIHQKEIPAGLDLIASARASLPKTATADLERRFLKTIRKLGGEQPVQT